MSRPVTGAPSDERAPTLSERVRIEWPLVVTLLLATASYVHTYTTLAQKLDALIATVDRLVTDVHSHEVRMTRIEATSPR